MSRTIFLIIDIRHIYSLSVVIYTIIEFLHQLTFFVSFFFLSGNIKLYIYVWLMFVINFLYSATKMISVSFYQHSELKVHSHSNLSQYV